MLRSGQVTNNLLGIDFESYYDSKKGYTLKKMSMLEYIKDPRFKAFGACIRTSWTKGTMWVRAADLPRVLAQFDWKNITLLAQNTKFDGAILAWHYGITPKSYVDTKSMAAAMLGTLIRDNSLATIAAHFKMTPKGFLPTDGIEELTPEMEEKLAAYCTVDLDDCWDIYARLLPGFPKGELAKVDWTIRRFIHPMLVLDPVKLQELNNSERARKSKVFEDLVAKYPYIKSYVKQTKKGPEHPSKVFSSNDRFAALLRDQKFEVPMKLSPTAKKKNKVEYIPALAVGDSDFKDMLESESDELRELCEARVQAKSNILETRSAKYLKLVSLGPWPFDMNYSGAKQTHRLSGASGGGGNPQNLRKCQNPKEHKSGHTVPEVEGGIVTAPYGQCNGSLRASVCAPEGFKLGVADFAGIELRIAAWLACELKLMSAISEDRDVYSEFASKIYERLITKKDVAERQFGKICILGLGYGMGWEKFIYTVRVQAGKVIDEAEARRVVELYRHTYDRIESYWRTLNFLIPRLHAKEDGIVPNAPFLKLRNGEIILPSGLPLRYPNLRQEPGDQGRPEWVYDIWRNGQKETTKLYGGKLLENICQALAGEITKTAIDRAEAKGLFCAGQVHDEILALLSALNAANERDILRTAMETPMPWWPVLKLKAEIGVGPNWLEAKG